MSIIHYLEEAMAESIKTARQKYGREDASPSFLSTHNSIAYALETWQSNVLDIIDVRNWRIDNLIDERGTLHKPKIYLRVEVTSRDNLILEWYPWAHRTLTLEQTDWIRWSDLRPIAEMPWNRIIQISDFRPLIYRSRTGQLAEHQKDLILATHSLLELIYSFLRRITQVTITSDLHIDWSEKGTSIAGARIMTAEEIAREQQETDKLRWLKKTFGERLYPLTPGHLLQIFKENDMKVSRTRALLKNSYLIDIGHYALRNTLTRLQSQFPELCEEPHPEPLPEPRTTPAKPHAMPYHPRLLRPHPDPKAKIVVRNPGKLKIDEMGRPKKTT